MGVKTKDIYCVTEVAKLMGFSRTHVLRKIKAGEILATKVGKTYIINRSDLLGIYRHITDKDKQEVKKAVDKTLSEYEEVIRKLGKT
jgi:excisionase family DNA binding protein